MERHLRYITALTAVLLSVTSAWGLVVTLDSYDTHDWEGSPGVTVVGFNATHAISGEALQVRYNAASGEAAVSTDEFLTEVGTGLAVGITVEAYTQAVGGATGAPTLRIELIGEGDSVMAGGDTVLSVGGWYPLILPAGSITQNYKRLQFVIGDNGGTASGEFDIWLENVRREAEFWDVFAGDENRRIEIFSTDGAHRGEATRGGSTLVAPGPTSSSSVAMLGLGWSGDSDGEIEIRHLYANPIWIPNASPAWIFAWAPTGTALPTVGYRFSDGTVTSTHPGVAMTAHDAWEEVRVDVSGLATSGIDFNAITEITLILTGLDPNGTLFIDASAIAPAELTVFDAD